MSAVSWRYKNTIMWAKPELESPAYFIAQGRVSSVLRVRPYLLRRHGHNTNHGWVVVKFYFKPPGISDTVMHHGTCVTHVPWCMTVSLISGGGENVPGIPGACTTRTFTYLARGPFLGNELFSFLPHHTHLMPIQCAIDIWRSYFSEDLTKDTP